MDGIVVGECGRCTEDAPDVHQEAPSATGRWKTEAIRPSCSVGPCGRVVCARQALERDVAPGTLATLRELTNPARRPPVPRQGLSDELRHSERRELFRSDAEECLLCLRTARRGAASGPSGMTADHLFPILESEPDSELLVQVVSKLACGDVPQDVINGIRLGILTALNKPDGGVRGVVVGDIIRCLVAKTMASRLVAKKAGKATAPFQYALPTKAGCECIAHILQGLTDRDANVTVVTVDGVGAYDLISRNSMMEGFLKMEDGDQILPFVRCFYGSPSTYLWEDEMGVTEEIPQGEGGEQGDPPQSPCCSCWDNMQRWRRSNVVCGTTRSCSHSSMI